MTKIDALVESLLFELADLHESEDKQQIALAARNYRLAQICRGLARALLETTRERDEANAKLAAIDEVLTHAERSN